MASLSEEHLKVLLSKEWLVKVDANKSTPYLFKFYASIVDISCVLLITDTKSVWAEVLNSNQFARRWRSCNGLDASWQSSDEDEDEWRLGHLENLTKVHSLSGVTDLSFDVVDNSRYSDLAIEMECEAFKWRWESCFIGYKDSAEIISKHLVLPLISVNHLAFSTGDGVGEMTEPDLEKAIDKVGRTARRTLDTHIKNAISKPRVATAIRRMTAMFNFLPDLPGVYSTVEKPKLQVHSTPPQKQVPNSVKSRTISPGPMPAAKMHREADVRMASPEPESSKTVPLAAADGSETEDESDQEVDIEKGDVKKGKAPLHVATPSPTPRSKSVSVAPEPKTLSKSPSSDTEPSSPAPPPAKKPKPVISSSSDDDSDSVSKRRTAQNTGFKRGTRQPIKRGGKRF